MSWNYFWFFEAGGHGKPGAIFHPRQKGSNGGNFSTFAWCWYRISFFVILIKEFVVRHLYNLIWVNCNESNPLDSEINCLPFKTRKNSPENVENIRWAWSLCFLWSSKVRVSTSKTPVSPSLCQTPTPTPDIKMIGLGSNKKISH